MARQDKGKDKGRGNRDGNGNGGGSQNKDNSKPPGPAAPGYKWAKGPNGGWYQTSVTPTDGSIPSYLPDPKDGYHWEPTQGGGWTQVPDGTGSDDDSSGGDNRPPAPGNAWIWNGAKWVKPDMPSTGGPYLWDDDSGWVEDVNKIAERQSALETLMTWFQYVGIDDSAPGSQSLSSMIWSWIQQDKSIDWIKLELRKTEQYKARFPGMDALSKKGMAISEAEYIANERAYLQVMKAAGMPAGFYDDRQDFANFMVAEVSPQELSARVQIAKDYVQLYAPKSVKDQLQGLYGFTDDQMAAYVLDTSENKMKSLAAIEAEYTQRKSQAQIGGAAVDAGYDLSSTLRDQIASMGYDYNQAASGFYRTQQQADPYARLGIIYGEQTSTDELLQETFGLGGAAETATKKKKLASRERATFSGTSAIGASSLGTNQAGRM